MNVPEDVFRHVLAPLIAGNLSSLSELREMRWVSKRWMSAFSLPEQEDAAMLNITRIMVRERFSHAHKSRVHACALLHLFFNAATAMGRNDLILDAAREVSLLCEGSSPYIDVVVTTFRKDTDVISGKTVLISCAMAGKSDIALSVIGDAEGIMALHAFSMLREKRSLLLSIQQTHEDDALCREWERFHPEILPHTMLPPSYMREALLYLGDAGIRIHREEQKLWRLYAYIPPEQLAYALHTVLARGYPISGVSKTARGLQGYDEHTLTLSTWHALRRSQ